MAPTSPDPDRYIQSLNRKTVGNREVNGVTDKTTRLDLAHRAWLLSLTVPSLKAIRQ
jgi:hypothetical protein